MDGDHFRSARLRYRRATIDEALALVQEPVALREPRVGGYPDEGTRFFALRMLERGTDDADAFAMYHIIDLAAGTLVGHIGFQGHPDRDQSVRIGYAIASSARRQGYAGEALAWILELATTQPGVRTVRADTSLDNLGSQRVLERGGFELVRDDGQSRYYEKTVTGTAPVTRTHRCG